MSAIGRHVSRLSGYAPALPTPFAHDGSLDGSAFEHFCISVTSNLAPGLCRGTFLA